MLHHHIPPFTPTTSDVIVVTDFTTVNHIANLNLKPCVAVSGGISPLPPSLSDVFFFWATLYIRCIPDPYAYVTLN